MASTVGVIWSPELEALKRQWATMADRLAGEADHRAEEAAQGAAVEIRTKYAQHWVTGTLVKRVRVTRWHRGKLLPGWAVYGNAPHTWLFEHGSKPRYYVTKPGKAGGGGGQIHRTGAMWGKTANPGPTFFPVTSKFRRALELQLVDLLRREGATVTVDQA